MSETKTEFLFAPEVEVFDFGDTPYGRRRVARFANGSFQPQPPENTVPLSYNYAALCGVFEERRPTLLLKSVRLTMPSVRPRGLDMFPHPVTCAMGPALASAGARRLVKSD
jgi:hypothetical protein